MSMLPERTYLTYKRKGVKWILFDSIKKKMFEGIDNRPNDCENCWENKGRNNLNEYKSALLCNKCYEVTVKRFGQP